ncbi:RlpA-like double-psi beta-barrel-protein domain-containing protein-containing protein [Trametes elegans]|nr:RlpA-like double-psi beta-barrel-protein domain-containing protein-containing protein [Trametes elegans]
MPRKNRRLIGLTTWRGHIDTGLGVHLGTSHGAQDAHISHVCIVDNDTAEVRDLSVTDNMFRTVSLGLSLALIGITSVYSQTSGTTTTTWNCCEPTCGSTSNLSPGARGPVQSCNENVGAAASGAQNACFASSGTLAFSCAKYQPIIVNDTLLYGFARHGNTATSTCPSRSCSGGCMAADRATRRLQVLPFHVNLGRGAGKVHGCSNAGGVTSDAECSQLPSNLPAGCHWRWQWAKGDMNEWCMCIQWFTGCI